MENNFQKPINYQDEKSFIKKIFKLFFTKYIFFPPKKKKILIFDNNGLNMLLSFFKRDEVGVYYRRYEQINLFILFLALFDFKIKTNLKRKYQYNYIKYVKPKLIITYTDNLDNFYKIKKHFKNIKTISIQNGLRNISIMQKEKEFKKTLNKKTDLQVDYLFTFNESYKNYFSKYIDGTILLLGSMRNNFVKVKKKEIYKKSEQKKSLLFISQFNYFKYKEFDKKNYYNINSKWYSYKDFKKAEFKLIPKLVEYCNKKKILLKVLGKTSSREEYEFFKNLIKDDKVNWKYYPKSSQLHGEANNTTYKLIDEADAVVFIDSALGYESLSRDTPTASFSIRGEFIEKLRCFNFGFPAKLADNGPFWTNFLSKEKTHEILDFVLNASNSDWDSVKKKYADKITFFSKQNLELKKILQLNI